LKIQGSLLYLAAVCGKLFAGTPTHNTQQILYLPSTARTFAGLAREIFKMALHKAFREPRPVMQLSRDSYITLSRSNIRLD
jgi:hypothetical protein